MAVAHGRHMKEFINLISIIVKTNRDISISNSRHYKCLGRVSGQGGGQNQNFIKGLNDVG